MNQSELNSFQLNSENAPFVAIASDYPMLEFDGFSLQSSEIISQQIKIFSTPQREIVYYRIPRADGGKINGDYLRERKVVVSGYLKQTTSSLLEAAIMTFKRRMMLREGNLDIKIDGIVYRIPATVSNPQEMFERREGFHITYCPFDLEFLALDPFFHDLDYTSVTTENNVALVFTQTAENLGTIYARPIITVIIEAASSVTAFDFQNVTNGDQMTITTPLVAGDILVIDAEQSTVTKNGVDIDYDGVFPRLDYGSNNCQMTTTGTSVQYTSTISYKQAYL